MAEFGGSVSSVGAGVLIAALLPSCGGRAQSDEGRFVGEAAGGAAAAGSPNASGGATSNAGAAPVSDYTRQCADALSNGQTTRTCDLSCSAVNDCCGAGAYCDASGTWTNYAPVCGALIPPTACAAPEPTSTLSGTTPVGPLNLRYVWAAETTGFSHSLVLFFTQSSVAQECEATSLGFNIYPDDELSVSYLGQREAVVLLRVNGMFAFGAASIQIIDKDQDHTHGTLTIRGAGWDVSGEFTAPRCSALDTFDDGK